MSENTFNEVLSQLDAGVFSQKTMAALREVGLGVLRNPGKDNKGKITIELTFVKNPTSDRVEVSHKLSFLKPTLRGKSTEEDTGSTPMFINKNGGLSVSPEAQDEMFNEDKVTGINNG